MEQESLFIRWAKAFVVYFCIVVTMHSLVEYMYAHTVFKIEMFIMGIYVPSAYVYGLTLGLVLSVAHFVMAKTIRKGERYGAVARPAAGKKSRKGARKRKG